MRWYFTFGQAHVHPRTGESMKDYWVEVEAEDRQSAYAQMVAIYNSRWSMQYKEEDFDPRFFPKGCYESLGGGAYLLPSTSLLK